MNNIIKNGLHIPFLFFVFNIFFHNSLISYTLMMKFFSINYYLNYRSSSSNLTFLQYQIKPWIRFTDTGYISTLIYYFYPHFFPIAFNIHFAITIGYWVIMFLFTISNVDIIHKDKFYYFNKFMSYKLHILPLFLLSYDFCSNSYLFDNNSLFYSVLWSVSWFLFILLPWKYFTNDSIYSIFDDDVPFSKKSTVVLSILALIYISNTIGINYSNYICSKN